MYITARCQIPSKIYWPGLYNCLSKIWLQAATSPRQIIKHVLLFEPQHGRVHGRDHEMHRTTRPVQYFLARSSVENRRYSRLYLTRVR